MILRLEMEVIGADDDYAASSSPPFLPSYYQPMNAEAKLLEEQRLYATRPTRYTGPDSTWMTWTEKERLVSHSVDEERTQDLGLHLTLAHSLKRKTDAAANLRKRKRKGKERARSGTPDGDAADEDVRFPGWWTAWPMPPDQVPRLSHTFTDGDGSPNNTHQWPSSELERSLLATITRLARERWKSREWEGDTERGVQQAPDADQKTMIYPQKSDYDPSEDPKSSRATPSTPPQTAASESTASLDSEDSPTQPGMLSQVFLMDDDEIEAETKLNLYEGDLESESGNEGPPTPIADDDVAQQLLLPSTRHILAKLDDLLGGLHTARAVYAGAHLGSRSRGTQQIDDSDSDRTSRQRSRSKRARSVLSRSSAASRSPQAPENVRNNLGLRDWSDVVGMASLTGWDPAVVERASERCAKIFGENMLFRTFPHQSEVQEGGAEYVEHYAIEPEAAGGEEQEFSEHPSLVRISIPCKACKYARRACYPLTPGKGVCQNCTVEEQECSGINSEVAANRCCPFRGCERRTIPFDKLWRLQRHISALHEGEEPVLPSSPSLSSGSEAWVRGRNGIFCPKPDCRRHLKGFTEGGKLYRHIRAMHPEIDVETVKKLEIQRRGETRGKWTGELRRELGIRSRSKSSARLRSSPPRS
jgi:hypothetical protein